MQIVIEIPTLIAPDPQSPSILYTDASDVGIGALLAQIDDGKVKPIDMASRRLLPAEKNYHTTEKELLAIVWATKKWRHYLEGSNITIYTDHKPITMLKQIKTTQGRMARWLLHLSTLDAKIVFYAGKSNTIADGLSRMYESEFRESDHPKLKSVLIPVPLKDTQEMAFLYNNDCFANVITVDELSLEEIRVQQQQDPCCQALMRFTLGEESTGEGNHKTQQFLRRYVSSAIVQDGILFVAVGKQQSLKI